MLPEIWRKNTSLLPEQQTIEKLMLKWDSLQTSWVQNDILGCILPNNTSKKENNFSNFLVHFLFIKKQEVKEWKVKNLLLKKICSLF